MIVNVNMQQVFELGGAEGDDGQLGGPRHNFILHHLDLSVVIGPLFVDAAVFVFVLLQMSSWNLCMSVHGNAGEVVPDDLVNCREKRDIWNHY